MSIRLSDDDATLAAKFSSLKSPRGIAALLEVTPAKLAFYLRRTNNYKVLTLHKRSGGVRTIYSPATPIKIIQRKLNQVLTAVYRGRSPVHGFARGKSIVTNAKSHLRRQAILNFDLKDFFPSIHFGRIKGLLESKPYSLPESVAVTLAQICSCNATLPAGAPTSPVIANMLCAQMDSQLKRLALGFGCFYTRYADDITISVAHGRFPPAIVYRDPSTNKWVLGNDLMKIISANGFKVNESKTRVLWRGSRQEVTGLIVGERTNVKRSFLRQTRAMLHAAETWGVAAAEHDFLAKYDRKQRSRKPNFLKVLRGKIEFIGSVRGRDDDIYVRLFERYLKLDRDARFRPILLTRNAALQVMERAIWLLEEKDGKQGTAFAAEGLDLITAEHVLGETNEASCPALRVANLPIEVIHRHDHVDVARISARMRPPVQLRLGNSGNLGVGDPIKVLGFPLYRMGASVNIEQGRITAVANWHGVPHFVVDCSIVHGNSGGPVLNAGNEIVGVAVKGQGVSKRFADDDEQSRFVPINFALQYLT